MVQGGPALAKIREIARRFRENARETLLLEYARVMIRTARELEDLASGMERGELDQARRAETFAGA